MKQTILNIHFALRVITTLAVTLFTGSVFAACIQNDTGRNLYMVLASTIEVLERGVQVGDRFCLVLPEGETARVSIVAYGGARFGCSVDLTGDEMMSIGRFSTLNQCKFRKLSRQ